MECLYEQLPQGSSFQLYVEDTQLDYPIPSLAGKVKSVPALRFLLTTEDTAENLEDRYLGDTREALLVPPEAPQDVPLVAMRQTAFAHYGLVFQHPRKHAYILPLRVYDIRDKGLDKKAFQPPEVAPVVPDAASQAQEQTLLKAIAKHAPQVDRKRIQEAIDLARQCHAGTFRKSGEPFYHHPMEVTRILLRWTQDEEGLIAALLHDTVEDTPLSLSQIALLFSPRVSRLVAGVTKLDATGRRLALSKEEKFQRLTVVTTCVPSKGIATLKSGSVSPKRRHASSCPWVPAVGRHRQSLVRWRLKK